MSNYSSSAFDLITWLVCSCLRTSLKTTECDWCFLRKDFCLFSLLFITIIIIVDLLSQLVSQLLCRGSTRAWCLWLCTDSCVIHSVPLYISDILLLLHKGRDFCIFYGMLYETMVKKSGETSVLLTILISSKNHGKNNINENVFSIFWPFEAAWCMVLTFWRQCWGSVNLTMCL